MKIYIFIFLAGYLKIGLVPAAKTSDGDEIIAINSGMNGYAAKSVNISVLESFNRFWQIFFINL